MFDRAGNGADALLLGREEAVDCVQMRGIRSRVCVDSVWKLRAKEGDWRRTGGRRSFGQPETPADRLDGQRRGEYDRLRRVKRGHRVRHLQCSSINELDHNQSVLCQFITNSGACSNDGGLLNYFSFVYCLMPLDLLPLTMIMLVRI